MYQRDIACPESRGWREGGGGGIQGHGIHNTDIYDHYLSTYIICQTVDDGCYSWMGEV